MKYKTMKFTGSLLIICLILASCTSSKKLLEKGKYDQAIEKSVKALRKDPADSKELAILKEAYQKANHFDNERIDYLESEGRSENWLEIYNLYSRLESRQNWIESLPGNLANRFILTDYDDELIDSKQNAADFAYNNGIAYLERGDKESARLAFREFERVKNLYGDYRNVSQLIQEAHYRGTSNILFRIQNNSEVLLPMDFEYELRKISLKDLNDHWTNYDTDADTALIYDYYIVLNLNEISVSPESIDRESYTETAEIQDGFTYVFDENGNVKKDSLGNDIKVPNMITVSADVTESRQYKHGTISGSLDYIDLKTDQLIKTEHIAVDAVFEHFSAVASGHEDALSEETKEKLQGKPVPFPSDEKLLMDAAKLLKDQSKAIVMNNRLVYR